MSNKPNIIARLNYFQLLIEKENVFTQSKPEFKIYNEILELIANQ